MAYEATMGTCMRAMALVGSFGLDHLKLIERPMPEPRHNEVVIRMAAVSLNYRDMDMVLGTYPFKFPLPLVPTSDGVGEVVGVGEGVTRAKVGDRVLGTFHQSWIAGRYEEVKIACGIIATRRAGGLRPLRNSARRNGPGEGPARLSPASHEGDRRRRPHRSDAAEILAKYSAGMNRERNRSVDVGCTGIRRGARP